MKPTNALATIAISMALKDPSRSAVAARSLFCSMLTILKVSFGNYTYPVAQDFLRATESQGIPTTDDLQDLVTGHGAEHWLKWINRDTGRRSDSAHAYIHSTMR